MLSGVRQLACAAVAAVLTSGAAFPSSPASAADPLAFFAPEVVLSTSDRRRLARDEVIARVLEGDTGQLAIFVASRLDAPPDALAVWTRAIEELKRSNFVQAVHRFSDPPVLSDLDALTLDTRDLQKLRECVPGDCGVKLTAQEIDSIRRVASASGTGWQNAVQAEFRRVVLARLNAYRAGGLSALSPVADRSKSLELEDAFAAILARSPYLNRLPNLATWLRTYPAATQPVESFFYWSKETYGRGKPVIAITHVGIAQPGSDHRMPVILVMGKQILATHYIEGSLGLTMVMCDRRTGLSYLVYINRSRVDLLRGFWGGFIRGTVERRLERDAPQIVRALRARLEGDNRPSID